MSSPRPHAKLLTSRGHSDSPTKLDVIAFPPAGAGPNTIAGWRAAVPEWAGVVFVQLPGREARFCEPLIMDALKAADLISEAVLALPPRPRVLLGHSMGALLAYLTALRLRAAGDVHLHGLVVSGIRPPHMGELCPPVGDLSDDAFLDFLEELGGLPHEIRMNSDLMDLMLPALRADFRLVEAYRHLPASPLECPIIAIKAADDPLTSVPMMEAWAAYTSGRFDLVHCEGDHMCVTGSLADWHSKARDSIQHLGGSRTTPLAVG